MPGMRALLTRDGDYFIPLHERYHIAEKAQADLFISIHCNSSRRRGTGSGTEVYFLSLQGRHRPGGRRPRRHARTPPTWWAACRRRPRTTWSSVLYDVKRNSALEHSQLLAETLLDHVAADRRVESRGVKQAGFAVLKSVEFPSVLVETAFINNPREARLLRKPGVPARARPPARERRARLLRAHRRRRSCATPPALRRDAAPAAERGRLRGLG